MSCETQKDEKKEGEEKNLIPHLVGTYDAIKKQDERREEQDVDFHNGTAIRLSTWTL